MMNPSEWVYRGSSTFLLHSSDNSHKENKVSRRGKVSVWWFSSPIYFCHVLFNAECEMQIKYLYRSTGSDKRSCTSFQAQSNLRLCVQHSLGAPLHFAIKNSYADFYLSTGNSQATYRVFMLITHSSHSLEGWLFISFIHKLWLP